jgi:competence protein ComEA
VDVNRATAAELTALPGIGPALAARIVASRETEGPFRTADDLLRVAGIGPAKLEAIRPRVRAAP